MEALGVEMAQNQRNDVIVLIALIANQYRMSEQENNLDNHPELAEMSCFGWLMQNDKETTI